VQIWLFVAPGLYRHEKRAFVPFLIATPFMFYAGCAVMYYIVLPYVINFMLTQYAPPDIEKTLRSSDYLERILQLVFAFGFAFEMPVLLTLLLRVGIISTAGLLAIDKLRRAAISASEAAQARRKALSRQIGIAKSKGEPADALMAEVATLEGELKKGETEAQRLDEELTRRLEVLPNLPFDD